MTKEAESVLSFLQYHCCGAQRALRGTTVAEQCAMGYHRVRACVDELRDAGHVICSSSHEPYGYYIPVCIDEVARCADDLEARGRDLLVKAAKLRRNHGLPPKQRLFEYAP